MGKLNYLKLVACQRHILANYRNNFIFTNEIEIKLLLNGNISQCGNMLLEENFSRDGHPVRTLPAKQSKTRLQDSFNVERGPYINIYCQYCNIIDSIECLLEYIYVFSILKIFI